MQASYLGFGAAIKFGSYKCLTIFKQKKNA